MERRSGRAALVALPILMALAALVFAKPADATSPRASAHETAIGETASAGAAQTGPLRLAQSSNGNKGGAVRWLDRADDVAGEHGLEGRTRARAAQQGFGGGFGGNKGGALRGLDRANELLGELGAVGLDRVISVPRGRGNGFAAGGFGRGFGGGRGKRGR